MIICGVIQYHYVTPNRIAAIPPCRYSFKLYLKQSPNEKRLAIASIGNQQ